MIIPQVIIPTVLIPFTFISVVLSMAASFIASLFGLHLSSEGPRRLLEALLKPRVIIFMVISNLLTYGAVQGWKYVSHSPRFEYTIARENKKIAQTSSRHYPNSEDKKSFTYNSGANSPFNLTLQWQKKLSSGSFAGALISGESVFLGTDAGYVEELDLQTGAPFRSFYIGTPVTSEPTIFNGYLYVGEGEHDTHHARVYKFDLATGQFVGAYATKGHTEGRTTLASWKGQDLLLLPSGKDGLHAINPQTMQAVWHRTEGHSDATAVAADGLVFWGTGREKENEHSSKVWAVAAHFSDGTIQWKQELPASSWMAPVIVDNEVCFSSGEIYFKSQIGGINCFERTTGKPTVSFQPGEGVISSAILVDNDLFATDFHGRICRFSRKNGRIAWCTETDGSDYSLASPVFDSSRNILIYASQKKGLFLLNPQSGQVVSQWLPPEPEKWLTNYAPAAIADKNWLLVDSEGNLRSLYFKL